MQNQKINKTEENNLKNVLKFVYNNSYSSFYKKKYQTKVDINNILKVKKKFYQEFKKIPFLKKDEILNIDLEKRTFLPKEKILGYSVTSGTTKHKKLLIVPFSHISESFQEISTNPKRLKKLGISKLLFLTSPLHGMVRHMIYAPKNNLPFTLGKMDDFNLCVNIIKEASIEGIISTPTIFDLFIPYLKKYKIPKKIKWVCLAGEHCSKQRRDLIKKQLPNALIDFIYGSTEAGIMGIRCDNFANFDPNIYHPVKELFIEILDEKGNPQKEDIPGNIVITTLNKIALPLIRYQIGDMGILRKEKCKCGFCYALEVLGRSGFDSIKIQGTIIHSKAVENALISLSSYIYPDFRLDVFEKKRRNKIMPELILTLVPKNPTFFENTKPKENLSKKISENLMLSSKSTLKDLIDKQVYLPLKLKFTNKIEKDKSSKTKYIKYHIS